ncbi:lymphocyte antigen 6D [Pteropus medius]|uniref:lymphocyte antigen 6D n=1 Tax=Pteropus vampyrus TaxID=132908 RepID=UPI00196A8E64|nr:lymphocyte antigen 6D [Pteropus giganteus]
MGRSGGCAPLPGDPAPVPALRVPRSHQDSRSSHRLSLAKAQALRCHIRSSATNCKNPQGCPASSHFCRTVTEVEPLSGTPVEKDRVDWCTPTYSPPGQVCSGTSATSCCQSDLCNAGLLSSAPACTLLTSTALGLALALGLLALVLAPSL